MNPLFSKKLPLVYTLLFIVLTTVITYTLTSYFDNKEKNKILEYSETQNACVYNIERLDGYP